MRGHALASDSPAARSVHRAIAATVPKKIPSSVFCHASGTIADRANGNVSPSAAQLALKVRRFGGSTHARNANAAIHTPRPVQPVARFS